MSATKNFSIEKSLFFVTFSVCVSEYSPVGDFCNFVAALFAEQRTSFIRECHFYDYCFLFINKGFPFFVCCSVPF